MELSQKKIAIVTHQMITGGIEKSLIELCKALQKKNAQITLYLEVNGGELYDSIPKGIKIIPVFDNYNSGMNHVLGSFLLQGKIRKATALMKSYIINRLKLNPVKGWLETIKYLDNNQEQYDYAFAYGAPISFSTYYVIKKINATKKYAWIHNDPQRSSLDIRKYKRIFNEYDKIICVSEELKTSFIKLFPEYTARSSVFYNIIDESDIKTKSEDIIETDDFNGTKILTVGRLCNEKGQDIIPEIVEKLLNERYDIRWYCVGDGELYTKVTDLIKRKHLQNKVILIGNKINPYPYFKMSDIYVQPSRHEGFGIALTEAKIMNLPIVTTDFKGACEQIEDGKTGFIVRFDVNDIYIAIKKMLDNETIIKSFKENLKKDKKKCISNINELLH